MSTIPLIDWPWPAQLALIGGIVIGFIFLGQSITTISEYIAIRSLIRRGRCIHWDKALERCVAHKAFLVVESRHRPRKIWCVMGVNASVLEPVSAIQRERGLIVIDPPRIDEILKQREDVRDRIVEVRFDEVLSRAC